LQNSNSSLQQNIDNRSYSNQGNRSQQDLNLQNSNSSLQQDINNRSYSNQSNRSQQDLNQQNRSYSQQNSNLDQNQKKSSSWNLFNRDNDTETSRDSDDESSLGTASTPLADQFKTDSDKKLGQTLHKVLSDNNIDTKKIFLMIDNGNVTVKGHVSSHQEKDRIQHLLQDQADVKSLNNKLEVKTSDATAYRMGKNKGPHADFHPGFVKSSPNLR